MPSTYSSIRSSFVASQVGKAQGGGFTIVELMVVITIVALLISMLLPVLSRSRDTVKMTLCQTNMRTLSQASNSYSTEYAGYLCLSYDNNSGNVGAGIAADMTFTYAMPDFLCDYVEPGVGWRQVGGLNPWNRITNKTRSMFSCPARPLGSTIVAAPMTTAANAQGHVYRQIDSNTPSAGQFYLRPFKRLDSLFRPSEIVDMTDGAQCNGDKSTNGYIASSDSTWFSDPNQQTVPLYTYPLYPVNADLGTNSWFRWRHMNNDTNVSVFFDGHTAAVKPMVLTYRNVGTGY